MMPPIDNPVEVMVPLLVMLVVPAAALLTAMPRPSMLVRLSPSNMPVPRMMPLALLSTLTVLVAPVPMNAPPLNTDTRPSNAGSSVPELLRVMFTPVRSITWPPRVAFICAPLLTLTVRPLVALLKLLRNSGRLGTPVQVTVEPAVEQVASAGVLTAPNNSPATLRCTARERGEKRETRATPDFTSTGYSLSWPILP